MKTRPILFSAPMVRALLAGTKTQTRRLVKITHRTPGLAACLEPVDPAWVRPKVAVELCPYGQPGDRLWVRETCAIWTGAARDVVYANQPDFYLVQTDALALRAMKKKYPELADGLGTWKVTPSIHMPRWASRLTLEITDVRVERLQAINVADALAEGIDRSIVAIKTGPHEYAAVDAYRALWESINGAGSWAANPWVWALTFKRVDA